jgi:hypothetical protein
MTAARPSLEFVSSKFLCDDFIDQCLAIPDGMFPGFMLNVERARLDGDVFRVLADVLELVTVLRLLRARTPADPIDMPM